MVLWSSHPHDGSAIFWSPQGLVPQFRNRRKLVWKNNNNDTRRIVIRCVWCIGFRHYIWFIHYICFIYIYKTIIFNIYIYRHVKPFLLVEPEFTVMKSPDGILQAARVVTTHHQRLGRAVFFRRCRWRFRSFTRKKWWCNQGKRWFNTGKRWPNQQKWWFHHQKRGLIVDLS